jgi:hypothetical protein
MDFHRVHGRSDNEARDPTTHGFLKLYVLILDKQALLDRPDYPMVEVGWVSGSDLEAELVLD